MMYHPLRALWDSTLDLHSRFFPDNPPDFEARYRVWEEESKEFSAAAQFERATPLSMRLLHHDHDAANELADMIVTGIGLLQYLGYSADDLDKAIESVMKKNNGKTLLTHQVNDNGKIARKS